jgi:hypothetical protein
MTIEATAVTPATIDGEITSDDVVRYVESGGTYEIALVKQDPEQVAQRINAKIIGASSAAELFGDNQVLHAQDYLGTPFQLLSVEWRNSDLGEGLPFYAVMQIATTEGEVLTMTTGAQSVCLKVAVAAAKGFLPTWVKIVKSDRPTEAGNYPLDIQASSPNAF